MDYYTKLFRSIIDSTVWQEPKETKLVWVTLLAMQDKHGEVSSSIPGLARNAGVTVDECAAALECFMSPDPYSRTKDDEGRRIFEIPGGWALINSEKYRQLASDADRKAQNAARQRRWRERKKRNAKVTHSNGNVTPDSTERERERERDKDNPPVPPKGGGRTKKWEPSLPEDLPPEVGAALMAFAEHRAQAKKPFTLSSWNSSTKAIRVRLEARTWVPADVVTALHGATDSGAQGFHAGDELWYQPRSAPKKSTRSTQTLNAGRGHDLDALI